MKLTEKGEIRLKKLLPVFALLLVVAMLAGCGGDKPGGEAGAGEMVVTYNVGTEPDPRSPLMTDPGIPYDPADV